MQERFHTFTVLIGSINRCIHKIKTEEMVEFDLKSSHVSCLYYLYKATSLTARELCDVCREDKASISRAVKYLEKNGYLSCASKTVKRYLSPLSLTEAGRLIGEKIAKKVDSILDRAAAGISDEAREIMYQALRNIEDNLQNMCEVYGT